jgi:DNA replication and repair protein RecF
MRSAAGVAQNVRVTYNRESGTKEYAVNGIRPPTLASAIGQFPVVILSPENSAATFGGPADRRRFLDLLLSQVSRVYLEDLLEYRKALRQRNRLLADARIEGSRAGVQLEPWSENLARYGGRIMQRRHEFVNEFRTSVIDAYRNLVGDEEVPEISYVPALCDGGMASGAFEERLRQSLAATRDDEFRRGLTVVGPHRDELALSIDGFPVQQYASQGQHKTLLVALKMAEFSYMQERKGESPLLLLDDVFSELDVRRSRHILDLVRSLGQTIITSADEGVFHGAIDWGDQHRRFVIDHGTSRAA